MLKLILFLVLCALAVMLWRSLRSRPPRQGRDGERIDPSRAVDAEFEEHERP